MLIINLKIWLKYNNLEKKTIRNAAIKCTTWLKKHTSQHRNISKSTTVFIRNKSATTWNPKKTLKINKYTS